MYREAQRVTPPPLIIVAWAPLTLRTVMPGEIEIWPSSTLFEAGEKLRVIVQGSDIYAYPIERHTNEHTATVNRGAHIIHTGGRYDSHLLAPVIPPD